MSEAKNEASELMPLLDCNLDVEYKLQPYQREMLDMIDSIPEGAEIKANLGLRRGPRVFAIKDGITYCYHGNRKWVAI